MYFANLSAPIISKRASYKGLRYGSTLSFKSPGKKPKLSPASTAGLVSIILLISSLLKAITAIATARYVFPVPAGPIHTVISLFLILEIYSF